MYRHTYPCRNAKAAFTILEVLIALTASLLLMLGLTRAFKLIGDRITSSQSELEMASSLREVTFRMRDELRRMTPTMSAPQKIGTDAGYFTYYEGPWTDATTTLIHGETTVAGTPRYFPTSRYGDLDDYLAFTTRSEPGRPFSGVVPSGVVEAVRLHQHFRNGLPVNNFRTLDNKKIQGPGGDPQYLEEDALVPVLIYAEEAEIAYFLSPGWVRNELGIPPIAIPITPAPTAPQYPRFVDNVDEADSLSAVPAGGDLIPDNLSLHRRVLLIRPDLNMTLSEIAKVNAWNAGAVNPDNSPVIPFMVGGIEPVIPPPNPSSPRRVIQLSALPQFSPGAWTGGHINSPNWMTGIARVQQWLDLSISRLNNASGVPTARMRANSLDELSIPDNRFASVRVPITSLGYPTGSPPIAGATSSMPVLALSPPHALIAAVESDGFATTTLPASPPFNGTSSGQAATPIGSSSPFVPPFAYSAYSMVGFVRPEFTLADHYFEEVLPNEEPKVHPTFRGGSDIVATDVIGFDIKVFDPTAPVAFWLGTDGVPGSVGDDDGDSIINNESELGYAGSDDELIDVSNIGFRAALINSGSGNFAFVNRGGFVDFGFGRLAGGSIGGLNLTRVPAIAYPLIASPFSGISSTSRSGVAGGLTQSGRFVAFNGQTNSFYQPTVDTWSDYYNRDTLNQTLFQPVLTPPGSTTPIRFTGSPNSPGFPVRWWTSNVDTAGYGGFIDGSDTFSQSTPPTESMPKAIKITVRVYDAKAGEVRQQSVIEHFTNQIN